MNSSESGPSDLQAWQVHPPRDPNFRAAVWRRIERARRAPTWAAFVRARAALLATGLVVTIGVSGWMGHAVARTQGKADRAALAAHYVAGLDARVQTGLKE